QHISYLFFFFFQAEDGIRDRTVTGVQTCALPISRNRLARSRLRKIFFASLPPYTRSHSDGSSWSRTLVRKRNAWISFGCLSNTRSEERRVGKECRYRW